MAKRKSKAKAKPTADPITAELMRQGAGGQPVSAVVFFADDIMPADLKLTAEKAVRTAEGQWSRPDSVTLKRVLTSAKSASVTGDAAVIASLQQDPSVKTVLPSAVPDIYPKPVDRKPG